MKVSQHAREKFAESKKIGKCVCFLCKCTGVKVHAQRTTQRLPAHLSSLCTAGRAGELSAPISGSVRGEENGGGGGGAAEGKCNDLAHARHGGIPAENWVMSEARKKGKGGTRRCLFERCECVEGTEKRLVQAYG